MYGHVPSVMVKATPGGARRHWALSDRVVRVGMFAPMMFNVCPDLAGTP